MTLEFQSISEVGPLLLGGPFSGHIDDVFVLDSKDNNPFNGRIYLRHGANLVAFNVSYVNKSSNWKHLWNHKLFKNVKQTSYPLRTYPWLVTNTMLDDGSDGIVQRDEDGIGFYRFDPNKSVAKLQGLSRDTNFRDLYGWGQIHQSVVLIGRFYRNTQLIGVMSRKNNEAGPIVQFYAAAKDRLESRKPHPLFPLRNGTDFTMISKMSMANDFYVADIQRNGQDCIILRKETQLEMYQFNERNELQQIAKVSLVDSSAGLNEQFFFVNLTGQPFRDVIHFTRHGLFVYQQNTANGTGISITDYSLIHYHAAFSETNGWMQEYDQSIRMVDTNGDGQDDLLFTGQKGLTVLEFDAKEFFWRTVLNPSSLIDVNQRFAIVVGATKAMKVQGGNKESFLLTMDEEKKLYLNQLSIKYPTELPEKSNNVQFTNPTVVPVPPRRSTAQIPLQVKRAIPVSERPILRWTEQHAEPISLNDTVDPVTGAVHFKLPIFKSTGFYDPVLPHSISLSYNSQSAGFSNYVGLGWTLDLPDNYISVDYRNSIFIEDWTFYITKDGIFFRLKAVSIKEDVLIFRESTLKYNVEFYQKDQRWLIQTEKETLTYGSDGTVQAIRWNLNWPHWRGIGHDLKSLKQVPVAWYLIQRRVRATGRIINYRYDINTIEEKNTRFKHRWTAAIRLKKIESSATITFDYARKEQTEYQSFNHLLTNQSSLLLFPVPLEEPHYLTGCQITSEDYRQRLEFVYQTDEKGRRLLKAIEQQITADVRESIFRFKYYEEKSEAAEMLLNEIQSPNELNVHFQYSKINTVVLPDPYSSVSHPIDEQPAIAYSQEYAIMTFRQRQLPDKIQLKILGTSFETLAELTALPAKHDGQVLSYDVRAYANFCLLLLKTNQKQKMCLFNRNMHDEIPKWNKDPSCFLFDHGALMQSSEAGVVLLEDRSDFIRIIELNENLSTWNEHRLKLPFIHVLRIEMFNRMVVGYDDRQLFICHPQRSTGQWRISIIEQLNGLINGGSSIIKKFRLPSDVEKMLIETLKEDVLQLSSNIIAVTSLHLNDNHQLLSKMRLYLLDDHFNVVRRREFFIQGERILELRHRVDHEGTGYQLAYQLTNEGFFRLRIVNVTGKLVEEMHTKIEQDANRNFNILETDWKKNITIWRDRDFKTYDKAKLEHFEEWKKMASGQTKTPNSPKEQPKGEQPTCDDVSYAPCNRYCHEMEALSKSKRAKLDDATRIKKNWDECYAEDWKKQWEKNMTIEGEQKFYKPMEKEKHKITQLKTEWKTKGIDISSAEKESQDILASLNANEEFQKLFDKLFLVNWSLHRVLMTPQGLQTGNGTLIQMMGDDWTLQYQGNKANVKENVPFSISLGNSFILEEMAVNHQSPIRNWTLYAQDSVAPNRKIGPPLHQLQISPQDKIINRYPIYLAYQTPNNHTIVVSFDDDGKVLGSVHTFPNEQLMVESSSYERLATLASAADKSHPEKMQFLTRSLRSIFNNNVAETNNVVKRIKMSNNDVNLQRFTGYEWDTSGKGNVTVTIIPGNDRKLAGWIRQTWTYGEKAFAGWTRTASEMFNSGGHSVQKTKETYENSANPPSSDSILWDANKQRIISDFSPFNLSDQMVSYYGFERYEVNNSSSPTRWRFAESDVVDGGFSLTGSSHLRLKANNKQSTLEGIFIPTEQNINYLASCWIRPSNGVHSLASTIQIDQVTTSFKAIVSANETEVVGLLGRIMRKAGDWLYVEVLINFDIIRRLYDESLNSLKEDHQKQRTIPQFAITLKVEAQLEDGRPAELDVDHIRFTPMAHDFKATVYDLENGQPVSIIGSSGSISRTVYYRGREMAVIEDVTALDGRHRLEQVATSSSTGQLLPTPKGLPLHFHKQPPCRIVFYPDNGGLYETFDSYAWRNRWIIPESQSRNATWTVSPGRLMHNHRQSHFVSADPSTLFGTDLSSVAIRFYYSLISSDASVTWKLPMGHVRLSRQSTETLSTLTFIGTHNRKSNILTNLPNNGELIVLTEGRRFFIWVDSVLLMDDVVPIHTWSSLIFEADGNTVIEDCIFLGNPRVELEYLNEWGEKMQTIQLESDTSVLVSQTLYDALGRPAINTKLTRITTDGQKPMLTYYTDFVSGPIDPSNPLSVWQTHRLRGEVDRLNALDRGVAFFRVEYDVNPLNEKVIEGLPGPEFTVNGPFAKKTRTLYTSKDNIDVVENHFPTSRGFRHKVEELANGTKKVAVLDENENRVALYIYVPGYDHLLSTYEYDNKKRLIKMLPPIYHAHAKTLMKSGPLLPTTKANDQHLSTDEIRWQKIFGTYMSYDDETDRLISKTTPDAGTFNYYYNRAGQVRLEIHSSSEETGTIDSIVFYEYDVDGGTVTRTGHLEQMPMSREEFQKLLAEGTLMNAKSYQFIDRAEVEQRHYDASLSRGERNATFVTHNSNYSVVEEMRWDGQDHLLELKQIVNDRHPDWQIRKTYYPHSNRLRYIEYPTTNDGPIQLTHHYNKLGQLIELTLDDQKDAVVRFTYHGSGQLASESFHPGSQNEFNRRYLYNSPGFLDRISDPYLTESISYTEEGYGQSGYGDGIVMKTKFNATWSLNADWRWFQIADGSKLGLESDSSAMVCFNTLKRNGYITKTGRPLKDYYYPFSADGQGKDWMPLVCGGRNGQQLAKILAQKRMPRIYGHRYAYGHHQELVKAKYFTDETEQLAIPFQPDSLANQTALNKQQSREIWKKLDEHGFILTDERNSDWLSAIANPAKSLLRSDDLKSGLQAVQDDVTLYQDHLEKMILNEIGQRRNKLMDFKKFNKILIQWKGMEDGLPFDDEKRFQQVVEKVHQLLSKTKDNSAWLDPKLKDIFRPAPFSSSLSDSIRILCQRFSYGLGQHPFDVASYEIDANGNHRKFYTGFHRYEFSYDEKKANQIRTVRVDEPGQLENGKEEQMIHDSQGNVIQALHKGIQRIEYNTASKRTTAIHLTDGRIVRFAYDGRGERILKQVLAKDGQMITEVHYLRDEDGRVLFDQRTTYSSVMALLPELRDAESMAVTTAYIYGPRGLVGFLRNGIFHSVWSDHSGSIRLVLRDGQVVSAYDYLPYGQLMRAYGSDPAAAIAYRYTGQEWDEETGLYNYHARLYDPDIGRFYQPDPRAQYFSPYKYVGNSPISLIDPDGEFGFLMALLIGIFAVGGAYLGGAAANNNWNPAKWDFKSGATWLGIVGGAIAGGFTPIAAGATAAAIGLPATIAAASATAYISAAAANGNWDPTKWDFSGPGTYNALFQGASTALGIAAGASIAHQFASKVEMLGRSVILTGTYGTAASKLQLASKFGMLAKSTFLEGTYGAAAGIAYGHGVMANDVQLNPFKWDFTNPATLNALLEGIDIGIDLHTDLTQISRGIYKLAKKSPKQLAAILPTLNHLKLKQLTPLLAKAAKGPLGKVAAGALTAYFMTSLTNGNFDPSGWDGSSFSTYEGFFNGLSLGVSARNMLKAGIKRFGDHRGRNSGQRMKLAVELTHLAIKKAFDAIRPGKEVRKRMKTKFLDLQKLPKLLLASDALGLQFSTKHLDGTTMLKPSEIQFTSNRLAEIDAPTNRKRKRQNEVFTDREIGSMGCGMKRIRRLKRGSSSSKPCEIRLPDPEAAKELNEDPVGFLKGKAISTTLIMDPTFSHERIQLANGKKFQFQLVQALDGPGYHLKVGSPSSNDAKGVQAYWLTTREKIHINPLGETRFIFTPELQGCSIYVKYNYDNMGINGGKEPTMTVYHHFRKHPNVIYLKDGRFVTERGTAIPELEGAIQLFDVNGNVLNLKNGEIAPTENIYRKDDRGDLKLVMEQMVKDNRELQKIEDDLAAEYDIAIRYEDYLGLPSNFGLAMQDKSLGVTASTPILFRDTADNQWYFASQKIWYQEWNPPIKPNFENFKIYPELYEQNYVDFRNQAGDRLNFGEYLSQWRSNLKTNGVFIKPLNSIPRSQSEANLLAQRTFPTQKEFKDYVQSVKADTLGHGKSAPSTWQDRIEKRVDVRDLDVGGKGRSRRSLLMETKNVTYPFKCQQELNATDLNGTQPSIDPGQYGTSSGCRPRSWINLLSPSAGRQIINSIVSIISLDSILQFLTVPRGPNLAGIQDYKHAINLSSKSHSDKTDYRDVTIGNCFTFSEDPAVVCYGHDGQTLLFAQSADSSPLMLEHAEDTFQKCRPIEWYGRPSVTCRGEKTTFIHTPYERTSAAVDLLSAVDGWLLMAHAAPGFYREVRKFFSHVKNVWFGPRKFSIPINKECKESWQKQMQQLDQLVAKCEIHYVEWALPLIEEIRQQIESLMDKSEVDTMDDARAVKTMTERLTALIEDVGELVECSAEDGDEVFYDCHEECPAAEEPAFNQNNSSLGAGRQKNDNLLAKGLRLKCG
ncbi:hypothetical protein GHT06_013914 [Daphnia sinensis]|uniref:Tox-SGS domain-containing protein n=1 Tax=Daphnia sinensis TaxID=1820382 RepID=A0AAD5PUL9_9CRUS|nr:hypothetical protein GHT06_013914 [Daphnia sinensis]